MTRMASRAEVEASRRETEALKDFVDRVARGDPDLGLYYPGDARPHMPWWRRLLKIPPPIPKRR